MLPRTYTINLVCRIMYYWGVDHEWLARSDSVV
jgi:hypothetical protein